VEIFLRYKLVI